MRRTLKYFYPAEYRAYRHAKTRCNLPSVPCYGYYGGRGIEFRFTSFQEFFAALGVKPSPSHSIDRINNDGHYEAGNVRWATRIEQRNNRSDVRLIVVNGQSLFLKEWAERTGVAASTIYRRLTIYGWCATCSVSLPVVMNQRRIRHCNHKTI